MAISQEEIESEPTSLPKLMHYLNKLEVSTNTKVNLSNVTTLELISEGSRSFITGELC
jgi:hypothetical protein